MLVLQLLVAVTLLGAAAVAVLYAHRA